jgi:thymidylate synthase
LRAAHSASLFRELGSNVWDANANENAQWLANPNRKGEDDLGDIYGVQWRKWPAFKLVPEDNKAQNDLLGSTGWECIDELRDTILPKGYPLVYHNLWYKEIDLLGECVRKIMLTPSDRRILFHAWNPAALDSMALPPCHVLYQFLPSVATKELSLTMYIRSWDLFLGGPFNIAEGALLLELVARLTGYTAKHLSIFSSDTHIYENSLEAVNLQLTRKPLPGPKLIIADTVPSFTAIHDAYPNDKEMQVKVAIEALNDVQPDDFLLKDYVTHPALPKVKMAV